jgi:hypothetical protein
MAAWGLTRFTCTRGRGSRCRRRRTAAALAPAAQGCAAAGRGARRARRPAQATGQPSRLNVPHCRAVAPRSARGVAAHDPARARRDTGLHPVRGAAWTSVAPAGDGRGHVQGPGMLGDGTPRRRRRQPRARPPSGPGRGTVPCWEVPCWRCHVAPGRRPSAPRSPASHITRARDLGRVPTACYIRRRGALHTGSGQVKGAASAAAGLAAATSDPNAYYKPFWSTAARKAIPSSDSANRETRRLAAGSASGARLGDINKALVTRTGVRWRAGSPRRPRTGQPRAPGRSQGRLDAGFDGERGPARSVQPP